MTERELEFNKYFVKIAENLDISDTMRDKAIKSYQAVGNWLGDCDVDSDVKIMPQGSFNLGTVIKPITDKDEYDIDLVCLLKNMRRADGATIKNSVGDRLKENERYKKMLDKEGKRCWTLNYDEFHMDILPCVPNSTFYSEPRFTEIKLTHKISEMHYTPKYSNPYKYHEWFEQQMQVRAYEIKKEFAAKNQVEIEKVPLYNIKTPLQRTVQLLKRHRDITYSTLSDEAKKYAPISMIITTLAAHAYNNESSVYEALNNILNNMENYIEIKNNEYWVENPAMTKENFAEKWNSETKYRDEFMKWLQRAKQEILVAPKEVFGVHNVSNKMQICFGENIVRKSFSDMGIETKSARESNSLYATGLTGGLTTNPTNQSKKVGGHTFFGK